MPYSVASVVIINSPHRSPNVINRTIMKPPTHNPPPFYVNRHLESSGKA